LPRSRADDGINIDFEPLSDVLAPANNPTVRDAVALADLIAALGARLHAVCGNFDIILTHPFGLAPACFGAVPPCARCMVCSP